MGVGDLGHGATITRRTFVLDNAGRARSTVISTKRTIILFQEPLMSATRRHPDSPPSAPAEAAHHAPDRAAWTHVLAVSVGLTALLCLLVVAFAWPATQLAPRSLPIVVAGPAEATAPGQRRARQGGSGRLRGHRRRGRGGGPRGDRAARRLRRRPARPDPDRADGHRGLSHRRPAADPARDDAGGASGDGDAHRPSRSSTSSRCRPADPRGLGLAALALPLVLGGLIVGGAMTSAVSGVGRRVVGVVLTAVFAGAALTGIAHSWLGVMDGALVGRGRCHRPRDRRGRSHAGGARGALRVRRARARCGGHHAHRQPVLRDDERSRDAPDRLGDARPVAAAGRHRDAAAVGDLLRRRRWDAGPVDPRRVGGPRAGARCSRGPASRSGRTPCGSVDAGLRPVAA